MLSRTLLAVLALSTLVQVAAAAEPPRGNDNDGPPTVPGGDIFGFTSGTDTGNPGDRAVGFETTTRFGRGIDRYLASTLKVQLSYTVAENFAVAFSPFLTHHTVRGLPGADDVRRTHFDGFSGEVFWRVLPRTASGTAITLSAEPRYARVDGSTGALVEAYAAEFKVFVDQVIVPDQLYGALNLNWAPGTSRVTGVAGAPWVASSGTNVSAALAFQINPALFVGAEARLLSAWGGAFFNRPLGSSLLFGPTLFWKINDNAALNFAWTPQIWGRTVGTPSNLDLANFERHQLRAKLTISF